MDLKDNQQNYNYNPYVINAGDTPSIQEGPIAKRPMPKIKGRLFLDTDQNILYRDTGCIWIPLQLGPRGPRGPRGFKGPSGISYITGIGAPTCDIGEIGSIYIDISTGQQYLKLSSSSIPNCTWNEYQSNPIYEPVTSAYYQTIRYDNMQFTTYGPTAFYKMWYDYSSSGGIAMATSPDGVNWSFYSNMAGISPTARHSRVLFDSDGFGTNTPYRIWYWSTLSPYIVGPQPQMIRTATSSDGINWINDTNITQDPTAPILPFSIYNGSYGPADILYFPENNATLDKNNPFNNRYIMYYDVTNGAIEEIALAVSGDGLFWVRIGNQPVLPRGGAGQWDENYACEGAVVLRVAPNYFKMWYSGGVNSSSEGIGCATSTDGINWTKSSENPVFSIYQGIPWRTKRTYNPWALYDSLQFSGHGDSVFYKLWITGQSAISNPDIGYATMNNCFWLPLK